MDFSIKAVGDGAVKVQFCQDVSPDLNRRIKIFCDQLTDLALRGIVEWVPAYDSVTIYYQPFTITYNDIYRKLSGLDLQTNQREDTNNRIINVPVVYGGQYGPDLIRVAQHNQLTINDVIERHQKPQYLVYMLGFLPGFPYLGGLLSELTTPRIENPRRSVAAGSVGIAHKQTGIYPVESPGGWNIIGKTPLKLVDMDKHNQPFLFDAGDLVRFYAVSETEFLNLEVAIANGTYEVEIERGEGNG